MMHESDHETTRIDVSPKAAKILLELAMEQAQAKLRLDIAGNMARAMCDAPDSWELKAENGVVFFAPAVAENGA